MERTALQPVVVRLGQVCGDGDGTWNEKEWFPSLVKSALTLDCLPSIDGVSGLLITLTDVVLMGCLDRCLDHCAAATLEMSRIETGHDAYALHIAHQRASSPRTEGGSSASSLEKSDVQVSVGGGEIWVGHLRGSLRVETLVWFLGSLFASLQILYSYFQILSFLSGICLNVVINWHTVQDNKLISEILIHQGALTQLEKYSLHFSICWQAWR